MDDEILLDYGEDDEDLLRGAAPVANTGTAAANGKNGGGCAATVKSPKTDKKTTPTRPASAKMSNDKSNPMGPPPVPLPPPPPPSAHNKADKKKTAIVDGGPRVISGAVDQQEKVKLLLLENKKKEKVMLKLQQQHLSTLQDLQAARKQEEDATRLAEEAMARAKVLEETARRSSTRLEATPMMPHTEGGAGAVIDSNTLKDMVNLKNAPEDRHGSRDHARGRTIPRSRRQS